MLCETKDVLTAVLLTVTALLGAVLALLAILPIALQLVANRVHGVFSADRERRRIRIMIGTLIGIATVLVLSLLACLFAIGAPSMQRFVAFSVLYALIACSAAILGVIVTGTLVLRAAGRAGGE